MILKRSNLKIPTKSIQKLIPYEELSTEGTFRNKNKFSKTYKIENLNSIEKFKNLLNKLDYKNSYQLILDSYSNKLDIYFTEIITCKNIKEADKIFELNSSTLKSNFDLAGIKIKCLNLKERLEFLHKFYRYKENEKFNIDEKVIKRESKKLIAPYTLTFYKKHFKMNDIYGKASALRNINSEYNFMSAFNKLKSKRIIISINFKSINSSKILELVEENINLDFKTEAFIPYQFRNSIQDIRKNLIDSISRKENLFLVNCKFINISKDLDALEKDYENMNLILKFNDYRIHELIYEQKQGLNDSLFLGNNDLKINETLTLDELLKLMPF